MINMKTLNDSEYFDTVNYIKGIKNSHRIWIELALVQGWRESEIAGLLWSDILDEKGKIRNKFVHSGAKKDSRMELRIHKAVRILLNRRKDKKGKVFEIKRNSIYRAWRRHQKKIWGEKRFEFHDLRRTAITKFYQKTIGEIIERLERTKKFARHQDLETTLIYLYVGEEERKKLWLAVQYEKRKKESRKEKTVEDFEKEITSKAKRAKQRRNKYENEKLEGNFKDQIISVFKHKCLEGSFQHQKLYFEIIGVTSGDLEDTPENVREGQEETLMDFLDKHTRENRLKAIRMIRDVLEGNFNNWKAA